MATTAGLHVAKHTEVTTYLPEIRLAEEETDTVLGYLRGLSGEQLTPPQETLATAIIEVLSDPEKRQRLSDALSENEVGPLRKTVDHDHFYAMAEVCEAIIALKAGDDRAPLPRSISDPLGGIECAGRDGRSRATPVQAGRLAVLEHDQDESGSTRVRRSPCRPVGISARSSSREPSLSSASRATRIPCASRSSPA